MKERIIQGKVKELQENSKFISISPVVSQYFGNMIIVIPLNVFLYL